MNNEPKTKRQHTLKVTEIYRSIQGESLFAGLPCVFIRLTGCNLRCSWCDSSFSFHGGTLYVLPRIMEDLKNFKTPLIALTGGEPLLQPGSHELINSMILEGYTVVLETNGSVSIEHVNPAVHIVMDLKCPASEEHQNNLLENVQYLKRSDEIKFVVCNRSDFIWAENIIKKLSLEDRVKILFSCVYEQLAADILAAWILDSGMQVRMQLQMHKHIWGNMRGV